MFFSHKNVALHNVNLNHKDAITRIKALVDMKADINSLDSNSISILHKLADILDQEQVKQIAKLVQQYDEKANPFLIQDNSEFKNTPLLHAIASGKKESAKTFIELVTDNDSSLLQPDENKFSQNTPLILAIKQGWTDVALRLIEKSPASINQCAADGFSPLHYACMLRQNDVIQALIDKGANINQINKFGAKPIDYYYMEFYNLDTACKYDTRDEKKAIAIATQTNIPDIQHAIHFDGLKNRGDIDEVKLGTPTNVHERILATREKVLAEQLDIIHQYGPQNDFQRQLTKHFDEVFTKIYSDMLQPPEGQQQTDKKIEVAAYERAKVEFIKQELQQGSSHLLPYGEEENLAKSTLKPK